MDYNKDSQNIAASFVNGTIEISLFITQERIGLPENLWNHECGKSTIVSIHAFKAWSDENFCKGHEQRRNCLYLLMRKVPQTSGAKLKEGIIFIGPQI